MLLRLFGIPAKAGLFIINGRDSIYVCSLRWKRNAHERGREKLLALFGTGGNYQ